MIVLLVTLSTYLIITNDFLLKLWWVIAIMKVVLTVFNFHIPKNDFFFLPTLKDECNLQMHSYFHYWWLIGKWFVFQGGVFFSDTSLNSTDSDTHYLLQPVIGQERIKKFTPVKTVVAASLLLALSVSMQDHHFQFPDKHWNALECLLSMIYESFKSCFY